MKIGLVLVISLLLFSCGGDRDAADTSADTSEGDGNFDDAAARYQEKVKDRVSESKVNSISRSWDISKDQARCIVSNIETTELMRTATDPEVQAKVRACGVDPAVVK